MRNKRIATIAACALLSSCDGGRLPIEVLLFPPPVFGPADSVFTDEQLLRAAYSDYAYPPGFYQEPGTGTVPYYVNTLSIAPACCQPSDIRELATDDPMQARAWAESTVAHSTIRAGLDTVPKVTERYFEFQPLASSSARDGVPMRAHRLAYLDRWMLDRLRPDSLQGRLNARPIDDAAIRDVSEYLWWRDLRLGDCRVLSSFSLPPPRNDTHVIYHARLDYGDWGMYDRIHLFRSSYRVSPVTGDIVLKTERLRTILGQRR